MTHRHDSASALRSFFNFAQWKGQQVGQTILTVFLKKTFCSGKMSYCGHKSDTLSNSGFTLRTFFYNERDQEAYENHVNGFSEKKYPIRSK